MGSRTIFPWAFAPSQTIVSRTATPRAIAPGQFPPMTNVLPPDNYTWTITV